MIYLDIDGVLILEGEQPGDTALLADRGSHAAWLSDQLAMPIVISSQRRISDDVLHLVRDAGLSDHLYRHSQHWRTPLPRLINYDDDLPVRGQEIDAHRRTVGRTRHLVIDDMPVLADQTHLVIDPDVGLCSDDRELAMRLLGIAEF